MVNRADYVVRWRWVTERSGSDAVKSMQEDEREHRFKRIREYERECGEV